LLFYYKGKKNYGNILYIYIYYLSIGKVLNSTLFFFLLIICGLENNYGVKKKKENTNDKIFFILIYLFVYLYIYLLIYLFNHLLIY